MVRLAEFSPQFADRVPILVRLYGAHVVIIPGLILVLVILHGLLVKRHRISPHPSLPTDATGASPRRGAHGAVHPPPPPNRQSSSLGR